MKTGLVMEGGAMRGMFTCGIIDVFMENGITFDAAVGVSAGAAFGINYKSHQIRRPLRYNQKYCRDKRYASLKSLITSGDLYNAKFCYDTLPFELDVWDADTFYADPMDFYCVATDVRTGKPVYHKCDLGPKEDIEWIRASASIPIVSRPVNIRGNKYLDGGMSDSIPLEFMEGLDLDRIVVIETQPENYRKTPQKYMPLIKVLLRKYPGLVHDLEDRHNMYNAEKEYIKKRELEGKVLVLRPDKPLNIGSAEKDAAELERVYLLGMRKALDELDKVKDYLKI
ncbi:MAG: patatin family protein [Lachnospiraceae bacterium]|nr:patatin family protein [Lachnospiraceae bacterium]